MTPEFQNWIEKARVVGVGAILRERHIELPGHHGKLAGPCPLCGGTDRFGVDVERGLFNCRGCGGKGQGAISFVQFLDGASFLQAVEKITGEPPPKDQSKPKPKSKPHGKVVCSYSYVDELGAELYQVLRYDPKGFSQRQPGPSGWINNLKDVRLVPYRLPDVIEAISNETPICIFEGEKDCDNAVKLGIAATTTAMGVAGKSHWQSGAYDEFFRGADVVLVPDQDADVRKGFALASAMYARLGPIAARVRLVDLSAKDFSDWLAGGGTREAFDTLVEQAPDFKAPDDPKTNGHDHGPEPDYGPPPDPAPVIAQPLFAYVARLFSEIRARGWLHAKHYVSRYVVMTVAPGGYGKSSLLLCNAVEMASGVGLIGPNPIMPVKTVYWNAEEAEPEEVERRIAALCLAHKGKIKPEMLDGNLFLGPKISNDDWRFAQIDRFGKVIPNTQLIKLVTDFIGDNKIGCAMLDPMVAFHHLPENDTGAMETFIKGIIEPIAIKTNACIELSHHTRKPSAFGGGEITADESRGAGAAVNASRSVRVLNRMTAAEAENAGVKGEDRRLYLRVARDKQNMTPPDKARWVKLIGMDLDNAPGGGDNVQAVVSWAFPKAFDGVSTETMHYIRAVVSKGNFRTDSRSPEWVGLPLIRHLGLSAEDKKDRKKAIEILKVWFEQKVLTVEERLDEKRKPREFVVPGPWRDDEEQRQNEMFS